MTWGQLGATLDSKKLRAQNNCPLHIATYGKSNFSSCSISHHLSTMKPAKHPGIQEIIRNHFWKKNKNHQRSMNTAHVETEIARNESSLRYATIPIIWSHNRPLPAAQFRPCPAALRCLGRCWTTIGRHLPALRHGPTGRRGIPTHQRDIQNMEDSWTPR